jgi:hypothetical protein
MESIVSVTPAFNFKRDQRCVLRTVSIFLVLLLPLLTSSCARLAKVSDTSIPRLLTPIVEADFQQLVTQLKPFTELQSLRTSRVTLRFIEPLVEERWRDAEAILVLQRPDKIRVVVQIPVTRSRVADMVSEANHFKVAIYQPQPRLLIGTNDADYSYWREKLGKDKQSAMANARPFHFTEALLMSPLHLGEAGFTYLLEEQLLEETRVLQQNKTASKVWHSFYVITEVAFFNKGNAGQARVRRRFWFDRSNQLRLAKQQLFDDHGQLTTEVSYTDYQQFNPDQPGLWPGVVQIARPHDGYAARFTFSNDKVEINPANLPATAFVLDNKENLPVTDLDKPENP